MNYKFTNLKATILLSALSLLGMGTAGASVTLKTSAGWLESAYVEWQNDSQYSSYNVYCKPNGGNYTKIDAALVRDYGTYGRADVLGLSAGDYQLKVVPVKNSNEVTADATETSKLSVISHDRSGFAFTGSYVPGAYNANGTLKSNAVVIYVTEDNKDKITANVVMSSKGVETECTGIVGILTGLKKGYETRPFDIRFIGKVTNSGEIGSNSTFKGDVMIDLGSSDSQLTIEGVGFDATAYGWGVRIKNANYVEVRNLGFLYCNSDEGDDVGLQQGNNYIWVHHNDLYYGQPGSDADQVKGDGAMDCKKSNYITFSYNHFVDNGKCNLLGLSEGVLSTDANAYYITYHHNWYDHSDSRHPRCRYYNAHVYNNYYDGNAKYGAGSTLGSSVFMQNNYFRNCKYPMLTSMQGSDLYATGSVRNLDNATFSKEDGGTIKACGNIMTGKYYFIPYNEAQVYTAGTLENATVRGIDTKADFDAIVVTDPTTTVPSSVTSYKGSNYYSNFDTKEQTVKNSKVDPADKVVDIIKGEFGAGRLQHGDVNWQWEGTEAEDADYSVNNALKSLLANYKSTLVGFYGSAITNPDPQITDPVDPDPVDPDPSDPVNPDPQDPTISDAGMSCNFVGSKPSNTVFYTFVGSSYSNSKGNATVNGVQYTECLKLESATTVTFKTTEAGNLTLVFGSAETPSIKLNGTKSSALSNMSVSGNVMTITNLPAGEYTLTKENAGNIFYINMEYGKGSSLILVKSSEELTGPFFDMWGRRIGKENLQPMKIYISNGKRYMIVR